MARLFSLYMYRLIYTAILIVRFDRGNGKYGTSSYAVPLVLHETYGSQSSTKYFHISGPSHMTP